MTQHVLGVGRQRQQCDRCELWELRHLVGIRATYYLSLYIQEPALRESVLFHVTAAWALCTTNGGHPRGFDGFFSDYTRDVERDVDAKLRNKPDQPREFRRVWTNHAAVLLGDRARVRRRGDH